MTRKIYSAVMAGAAVLAATAGATSANAATDTATARARVLQALTLDNTTDLNFGAVVTDPTNPGTITISSAGARTACSGGISCSGTVGAANFNLTGTGTEIVSVTLPSPSVSLSNGSATMSATLALSAATVTLAAGAGSFTVGGSLTVGAAQAQGVYTGTFTVNADYQ